MDEARGRGAEPGLGSGEGLDPRGLGVPGGLKAGLQGRVKRWRGRRLGERTRRGGLGEGEVKVRQERGEARALVTTIREGAPGGDAGVYQGGEPSRAPPSSAAPRPRQARR